MAIQINSRVRISNLLEEESVDEWFDIVTTLSNGMKGTVEAESIEKEAWLVRFDDMPRYRFPMWETELELLFDEDFNITEENDLTIKDYPDRIDPIGAKVWWQEDGEDDKEFGYFLGFDFIYPNLVNILDPKTGEVWRQSRDRFYFDNSLFQGKG